jgi:hypothetical protein
MTSPSEIHDHDASGSPKACCQQCQDRDAGPVPDQFVYALGRLDVRMPTVGIEREFQQRERRLLAVGARGHDTRWERMAAVLRENPHLGRSVCFVLLVGGTPAYVVAPASRDVLDAMLSAVEMRGEEGGWALVIGRRGPLAGPAACGGVIAPLVACDQLYAFTLGDLLSSLHQTLEPALTGRMPYLDRLLTLGAELFGHIASSFDNMGALDSHRALNYLLVQHPGIFLAYAERHDTAVLDSVETRVSESPGMRRIVSVILTFLSRTTGVPERVFTQVDTTEEWPFLADAPHAGAPMLGLRPFIEHGPMGSAVQ